MSLLVCNLWQEKDERDHKLDADERSERPESEIVTPPHLVTTYSNQNVDVSKRLHAGTH